jgi:hypothetical protein
MRSYQNAGTGSTVYSLGGLGRYDGTMINSPTWDKDGGVFSGDITNQRVEAELPSMAVRNLGTFAVGRLTGSFINPNIMSCDPTTAGTRCWGLTLSTFYYVFNPNFAPRYDGGTSATANVWGTHGLIYNSYEGNVGMYNETNRNSPLVVSSNLQTTGKLSISGRYGANSGGNNFNGLIACAVYFLDDRGRDSYLKIRNLYKQTLGTGLGLN